MQFRCSEGGPGCLDQTSWSGEQMAWGKASNSGGQRRRCERAAASHCGFESNKHDDPFVPLEAFHRLCAS